jgi:hypothetical protein
LKELNTAVTKPIPIALVGNKKDLRETGKTTLGTSEGEEKASEITQKWSGFETPFVEASAIRREKADEPFERLAAIIYENVETLLR